MQNHAKTSVSGSPIARITPIWEVFMAPGICKNRLETCVFPVYGPSLEALFAIMRSTACILDDIFTFSPCFRRHLA